MAKFDCPHCGKKNACEDYEGYLYPDWHCGCLDNLFLEEMRELNE